MSKSHRTEFQKARRSYLDKCKKDGKKPMDVDAFYKAWHQKMQKKTNAVSEQPKPKTQKKSPVGHGLSTKPDPVTVHKLHKGDLIELVNFTPSRVIAFAIKLLSIAHDGLTAPADARAKGSKKDKKPAKR